VSSEALVVFDAAALIERHADGGTAEEVGQEAT